MDKWCNAAALVRKDSDEMEDVVHFGLELIFDMI
jgi:hypothetical protein